MLLGLLYTGFQMANIAVPGAGLALIGLVVLVSVVYALHASYKLIQAGWEMGSKRRRHHDKIAERRANDPQIIPGGLAPSSQVSPLDESGILDRLQQRFGGLASGAKIRIKDSSFSSKKTGIRLRGKVDLDMENTDVQGDEAALDVEESGFKP